ncbi:MAG: hypothetical protein K2X87_15080 [Gemmataceae bacterium]|nr:hypothetical protein [Gemmataceae bacterium]
MRTVFGLALVGLIGGLAVEARAARADEEEGPHKGVLAEWGDEEYHLELVVGKTDGTATVYVYGNHKDLHDKKMKAIDAKSLTLVLKTTPATTVKLEPAPATDKERANDPKGSSTKFVAKNDVFKKDMKWEGTISGKVGTKPYSGDFKQK